MAALKRTKSQEILNRCPGDMSYLISPHGGSLCNLLVSGEKAQELKKESIRYPSIDLTNRQQCDLELLLNGGFSPLEGFITGEDHDGVLDELRLKDGIVWPIPITLDISEKVAKSIKIGDKVALRDSEGFLLAVLNVRDIWRADKKREAIKVFGTDNDEHPGVYFLHHNTQDYYVGGEIEGVQFQYIMILRCLGIRHPSSGPHLKNSVGGV